MRLFFCELFMLVIAFGAHFEVSESSSAPTCITSGYLAKKEEATTAQLEEIAALSILSPGSESDSSSGTDAVYEKVLNATKTSPSSKAAASFYEAIAEVTSAYYKACFSKKTSSLEFTSLLAKYTGARERSDIKTLREAFGSLTCLKKRTLSSRRKRAPVKRAITSGSPADVDEFFDCLDGTDMGMIFFTTGVPFSVAFVIDDTGSMGGEIEAVKCLVRSFIKSERDGPSKYILGTFNDPEADTGIFASKSYDTGSLSDLQEFITDLNSITAHGGADWPEYAIGGIKRAFDVSIKTVDPAGGTFSQLLLFTDAPAKDYSDITDVFLLISSSDVVVSAFLPEGTSGSTSCGSYTSPGYQTCIDGTMQGYVDLVDESGGILVGSLTGDTSLAKFISEYNGATGAQLTPTDCSKRKKRSEETPVTSTQKRRFAGPDFADSFVISDLTEQFKVTITATSNPNIQIINPKGITVISQTITTIGFFHLGSDDMVPGTWKVAATSAFSMDVSVDNNFVFTAELLNDSNEPLESLPPLGCTANQPLLIFTPHLYKLSRSSSATFNATILTADGEVLGGTQLEHCGAYFRGRVTLPGRPFYIQFNGITEGNYVFNATVYNRFNPTPWTLQSVLTSSNTEVSAGGSSDLTFRLTTNTPEWPSCSLTVNIEAIATLSGITLALIPRQVTLRQSSPANFTVRATAASDTAPARGRLELSFSDNDGKELHTANKSTFIGVGRPGCPCRNGGKCISFRRGSRVFNRCLCPTSYYGTLCERTSRRFSK